MTLRPDWMSLSRAFTFGLAACASLVASDARAAAYHVQARTEAQAYQMRAYWGTDPNDVVLLPRRRIVQYLGLDAFELVTGQDLGFESNLRVSTDFGVTPEQAELVDGLRAQDVDLMYAHVRYRNGGFEGKAGRQYFIDANDIFAFDGIRARYVHSVGVGAEAYAGLWVKGASLLGSSNYQLDGIREQEHVSDPSGRLLEYDPFLEEQRGIEPVFGARLLAENVAGFGVSGAVGYRQSMIAGNTTSQRLGAELRYGKGRGINALSALEYDLYLGRVSAFRLQARYDAELFAATIEALRFAPTFSSYSLWYYFATSPRDELRLRGDFTPVGPFRYYAMVLVDHYNTTLPEGTGLSTVPADQLGPSNAFGAGGGAQFSLRSIRSAVDLTWRNGYGGRQFWLDYTAGYLGGEGRWSVDGRLSIASIRDAQNPLLRGTFYGAQLWGSYQLTPAARASLVVEENINPFTRSDTKVFVVFDLKAVL